jgi:hypothetical protein
MVSVTYQARRKRGPRINIKLIAQGSDWRFLNELKRELKA